MKKLGREYGFQSDFAAIGVDDFEGAYELSRGWRPSTRNGDSIRSFKCK